MFSPCCNFFNHVKHVHKYLEDEISKIKKNVKKTKTKEPMHYLKVWFQNMYNSNAYWFTV